MDSSFLLGKIGSPLSSDNCNFFSLTPQKILNQMNSISLFSLLCLFLTKNKSNPLFSKNLLIGTNLFCQLIFQIFDSQLILLIFIQHFYLFLKKYKVRLKLASFKADQRPYRSKAENHVGAAVLTHVALSGRLNAARR